MNVRRLGNTDIEISPIGLGCWQFSQGKGLTGSMWSALDQKTIDSIVRKAIKSGINWFDTAEAYGNGQSERALGTSLHNLKVQAGKVVIATKWLPILRTARNIPKTIEKRLTCLQGYPIDLYQIHIPWGFSSIPAQMQKMAKLFHCGKIQAVGVSNFSARQMAAANEALQAEGVILASNQVSINLLDRRIEHNRVLEFARRFGISLIAFSPLAQGLLTGRFHDDPELTKSLPAGRRSRFSPASRPFSPRNLVRIEPLIEALRVIGKSHGVSISQVALAWLISYYGDTVVAIPGATRSEQVKQNAAAMHLHLTDREITRIEEISAHIAKHY